MKIKFLVFALLFSFISCNNDDDGYRSSVIDQNLEVQNFIWKGLNLYYFWQQDVPNLADDRFASQADLETYLRDYSNPADLFYSLLFNYGTTDEFSWIVSDYVALENSFQGITLSNGVDFGLVLEEGSSTNVFGYVRYIMPDSDASTKSIERGDIFTHVNGIRLTTNNYRDLLVNSTTYTLELADYNAGSPTLNGETVTLTKSAYQENPVYTTNTFTVDGKKVGYLMYNAFNSSYNNDLNTTFGALKAENLDELVLDLRYNSGGSVQTATYLGSMITGQFNDQLFNKNVWNDKIMPTLSESRVNYNFTNSIDGNAIQSLNLDRVIVLTKHSTASASEMVINGLKPYINVVTIGQTTRGKAEGSITLYDSADFGRSNVNPRHTWAMQPITFSVENKLGENAPEGFTPNIELAEDYANLGVLGQDTEPLLARALQFIETGSRLSASEANNNNQLQEISNSKLLLPTRDNMYAD